MAQDKDTGVHAESQAPPGSKNAPASLEIELAKARAEVDKLKTENAKLHTENRELRSQVRGLPGISKQSKEHMRTVGVLEVGLEIQAKIFSQLLSSLNIEVQPLWVEMFRAGTSRAFSYAHEVTFEPRADPEVVTAYQEKTAGEGSDEVEFIKSRIYGGHSVVAQVQEEPAPDTSPIPLVDGAPPAFFGTKVPIPPSVRSKRPLPDLLPSVVVETAGEETVPKKAVVPKSMPVIGRRRLRQRPAGTTQEFEIPQELRDAAEKYGTEK